nr:MAG: putative RNA dependent RNA polymerase [Hainan mito-like virus 16]
MKNKIILNLLKQFRKHVKVPQVMFPVSKFWESCSEFYPKLLRFSMNRTSRLAGRARIGLNFITFLQKLNKHHGPTYTVKWMKACSVCLQKYLGGERLKSLRHIEKNLPLPALINGLPVYINKQDRQFIREGNTGVIRFWLTLFAFYRILSIPGVLKLTSITEKFNGDSSFLENTIDNVRNGKEDALWSLRRKFGKSNLAPKYIALSFSASPSSKLSWKGILVDLALLLGLPVNNGKFKTNEGPIIYKNIQSYLRIISLKSDIWEFNSNIHRLETLAIKASNLGLLRTKDSVEGSGLSQLSLKEEAAGKVRVFALMDSITQSVLKPLHEALFKVLQSLPNDGTFDQEASARRCVEKSLKYNCAYSFDLSSATDRLPVNLTAAILSYLFDNPGLGEAWTKILIERTYYFNHSQLDKYSNQNIGYAYDGLKYEVGQPMGALSSWAGLAITHHFILQQCANNLNKVYEVKENGFVIRNEWYDKYEILGDDIVIFDHDIAQEYLRLMKLYGLEINLSKSILSPNNTAFEFAKRTYIGGNNVSAIPIKMFFTSLGVTGRIMLAWTALNAYRSDSISVISTLLSRNTSNSSFKNLSFEALGTLSLLSNQGLIERKVVVDSVVDPKKGLKFDLDDIESFNVPSKSILDLTIKTINGIKVEETLPGAESRRKWSNYLEPFLVKNNLQLALKKLQQNLWLEKSVGYTGSIAWVDTTLFKDLLNRPENKDFNWSRNIPIGKCGCEWVKSHYAHPFDLAFLRNELENVFYYNLTKGYKVTLETLLAEIQLEVYLDSKSTTHSIETSFTRLTDVELEILKYELTLKKDKLAQKTLVIEDSNIAASIVKGFLTSKRTYWESMQNFLSLKLNSLKPLLPRRKYIPIKRANDGKAKKA